MDPKSSIRISLHHDRCRLSLWVLMHFAITSQSRCFIVLFTPHHAMHSYSSLSRASWSACCSVTSLLSPPFTTDGPAGCRSRHALSRRARSVHSAAPVTLSSSLITGPRRTARAPGHDTSATIGHTPLPPFLRLAARGAIARVETIGARRSHLNGPLFRAAVNGCWIVR